MIYLNRGATAYVIPDDCELKPWDDASFYYKDGSTEATGVYGPGEDLYIVVNQTLKDDGLNEIYKHLHFEKE